MNKRRQSQILGAHKDGVKKLTGMEMSRKEANFHS